MLRFSKRGASSDHMLRFSRDPADHMLRFSRSPAAGAEDHMLRFSRSPEEHMLRFGRYEGRKGKRETILRAILSSLGRSVLVGVGDFSG